MTQWGNKLNALYTGHIIFNHTDSLKVVSSIQRLRGGGRIDSDRFGCSYDGRISDTGF